VLSGTPMSTESVWGRGRESNRVYTCVKCAGVIGLAMITPQVVCRLGALFALLATTMAGETNITDWNNLTVLTTGTQIQITAGSRRIRGKVDRITDDALVVTSRKGQETLNRKEVAVVLVKKPSHRKRNALVGLAAGTGVGLGIGVAARSKPGQVQIISNGAVVGVLAVVGAFVGTIVGVVIPTGGWREIYKK